MSNIISKRRSDTMNINKGWCSMLYESLFLNQEFKHYITGGLHVVGVLNLEDEFSQVESLVIKERPDITSGYLKGLSNGYYKFIRGNRFPLTNTELHNATKDMEEKVKKEFFKSIVTTEPTLPFMCVDSFISDLESMIIVENVSNDIIEAIKTRLPKSIKETLLPYLNPEYIFSPLYEEKREYCKLANDVYNNKITQIVSEFIMQDRIILIDATNTNVKLLAGCSWWTFIHNITKE